MVEVVNAQRKFRIDRTRWRIFAETALRALNKEDDNVTIGFVSDKRIQQLNRDFRGKNWPTDVLSFPAVEDRLSEASLGDVVISAETAAHQATENGLPLEQEIAQLILHGLLHLAGYDHETDKGEMNRLELSLRRRLGI
jgi:probable rRNA maturation factor